MRSFIELFAVVLIGLSLGGALAWVSIQNNSGLGTLQIGQWTSWPLAGSVDADPYSKAKVASDGDVPLGAAEGIAFHAQFDRTGKPLRRECQYILDGQTPPARLWTLTAHEIKGAVLISPAGSPSAVFSRNVLRRSNGEFSIVSSSDAVPENWLNISGSGQFQFVLRLYDTPITSTRGIVDPQMPTISQLRCAS